MIKYEKNILEHTGKMEEKRKENRETIRVIKNSNKNSRLTQVDQKKLNSRVIKI